MHRQCDSSTYELARAKLKLADDLIFTPQQFDGRVFYHIEQPSRSRFFQIGWSEYTLISLLDGKTSLAEALSRTAGALGQEAFTEAEATTICGWLIEHDLAFITEAGSPAKKERAKSLTRFLNPFWMKFPLFHPDRMLESLVKWLGWLHSWPLLLLSLGFWIYATAGIVLRWEEFTQSANGVLAPANWIWLGAAWLGLKVLHEFSHALVCKRYGGAVPEMGAILMLFAPMAYVDVTSSWGFRSRWQRIHVAAAGMIAEFHIAAICAVWWMHTDSAVVANLLFTVIFMASLTTVLFNANPLMRFDGYYLLSDLLNIPNLSNHGSQYLKGLVSRWLLGTPSRHVSWRGFKGVLVRLYGLFAFLWRIVVCVGLILAASLLFHGAGLVLAAFAVIAWVCLPLANGVSLLYQHFTRRPVICLRWALAFSLCVGSGLFVWNIPPWPGARRAEGIIEYAPLSVVRSEVAGFVEEVFVEDGQLVKRGDILIRLRNEELETECEDLKLTIRQSLIKRSKQLHEGEIAEAQVEQKAREGLQQRLAELENRRERLLVRAPIAGRVMARELPRFKSTYLKEGTAILEIGEPLQKEVQIAISQPDIETYRNHLGQTVEIRLRAGGVLTGELIKLAPRATQTPPHPALCVPAGGPLAVKADTSDSQSDPHSYQLIEPRLTGTVKLSDQRQPPHEAGQLGVLALREETDTLGRTLRTRLTVWLRDQQHLFQTRP